MTEEKLKSLNKLFERIEYIKKELKLLDDICDYDNIYLTSYNRKLYVRIPRSLNKLIYNEVKNKLEIQLKSDENEFEKES